MSVSGHQPEKSSDNFFPSSLPSELHDSVNFPLKQQIDIPSITLGSKGVDNANQKSEFESTFLASDVFQTYQNERDLVIANLQHELNLHRKELCSIYRTYLGQIIKFYKAYRRKRREHKKKGNTDYQKWLKKYDNVSKRQCRDLLEEIHSMQNAPLISVLMPVYDPSFSFFEQAIQSVQAQLYSNWQLCIAGDASSNSAVYSLIERYAAEDPRITYVFRKENGQLSDAGNSALELAAGSFIVLLDQDDCLHPHALYYVVKELVSNSDAALIYSDEDSVTDQGERVKPYFKPDFNYDLFLCQDMISNLAVYNTSLARKLGGFRKGFEGSQNYDLTLRYIEHLECKQIRHIPRVLYHRRITVSQIEHGANARKAAMEAVQQHLQRKGVDAKVVVSSHEPIYNRIQYCLPSLQPLVDILIPTRDKVDLLKNCLFSILLKTTYPNYTITIIDNGSQEEKTLTLFQHLCCDQRIRIIHDDAPFNYSRLNNRAASSSSADYLCLMNNDTEVLAPDWLSEMVSHAMQPGVGAVGARLWYPDGTLQHAGMVLGIHKGAGHAHRFLSRGEQGYFCRGCLQQSFSAVTGACLLVERSKYFEVNGLNEEHLTVAYNDVDLCLKLRQIGYRNVWTPYAELFHHESVSRGYDDTPEKRGRYEKEAAYMLSQWQHIFDADPAYNPNLTISAEDFSLAWPPRVADIDLISVR